MATSGSALQAPSGGGFVAGAIRFGLGLVCPVFVPIVGSLGLSGE
jgi:hypothetical protein